MHGIAMERVLTRHMSLEYGVHTVAALHHAPVLLYSKAKRVARDLLPLQTKDAWRCVRGHVGVVIRMLDSKPPFG